MLVQDKKFFVALFLLVSVLHSQAARITYPGCDRGGWKCIKVLASPIKYRIEYVCPNIAEIQIVLWNFNAPAEIRDLKIINCTSVEIDLTCTTVGRQIESLHIQNVGHLNFSNILYKDVTQIPEKVIFENIKYIPLMPEKTFKQMKYQLPSVHKCASNTNPVDRIEFSNVNIGTIAQNAFYNLTDIKKFSWHNVNVEVMEPLAMQVTMKAEKSFDVRNGSFKKMDYKAMSIRSPKIRIEENKFDDLQRNVFDATSFQFDFLNNTVGKVHSFAFVLLSQDITLEHNAFDQMKTSALQGIGPGLLENSHISFGQLKFTYNFNNNTINHSDIGGLNPDWIAYKNVKSSVNAVNNRLPCSCQELGWITLRGGMGKEFSEMMTFNSKFLDKNNKNTCLKYPCQLPVTVMAGMYIQFGLCPPAIPLDNWCKKYNPNNTQDFGFGNAARMVLQRWQSDFPVALRRTDEMTTEEVASLESIYELAQRTEDVFSDSSRDFVKYGSSSTSSNQRTGSTHSDSSEGFRRVGSSSASSNRWTGSSHASSANNFFNQGFSSENSDQKTGSIFSNSANNFIKFSTSSTNPKEAYFKIEKSQLQDNDLLKFIEEATRSSNILEPSEEPKTGTVSPVVYFDKKQNSSENGTQYEYALDVRNGTNSGNYSLTHNSTSETQTMQKENQGFNTLKKEYETEQQNFVKNAYEEWQAARKKRMVYFKVYGNLMTVE